MEVGEGNGKNKWQEKNELRGTKKLTSGDLLSGWQGVGALLETLLLRERSSSGISGNSP